MQVSAKRWTERVLSCVSECFKTKRLHTPPKKKTVIQIWGKEKKKKKTGFFILCGEEQFT